MKKYFLGILLFSFLILLAGCGKKQVTQNFCPEGFILSEETMTCETEQIDWSEL